jgi:hypothetical protein
MRKARRVHGNTNLVGEGSEHFRVLATRRAQAEPRRLEHGYIHGSAAVSD